METLQEQIRQEAIKWYEKGLIDFPQKRHEIEFDFNLKGMTAGQAVTKGTGEVILRFNMELAEQNADEFLSETVPHEVAHIIANIHYKENCGHGYLWQHVMLTWKKNPMRCHDYSIENVTRRNTRGYKWECVRCGKVFSVGKNLDGKIKAKPMAYHCNSCNGNIREVPYELEVI